MACEHIPVERGDEGLFVITNGSPCQDLTSVSNLGTAGFAGKRLQQMIPSAVIVAIGENAG
eukprot:62482-Heterocapsa_arctica.AAC.1